MAQDPPKEGVYFEKDALLGFWSRILIAILDLVSIAVIVVLANMPIYAFLPGVAAELSSVIVTFALVVLYYVVLKPTSVRTVGYRILRARVVSLRGEKPTFFQMISRFSFILFGPLNGVIDLLWIPTDDSKRALRDMWSQTYVIRDSAKPAGSGPIVMQRYDIMGWALVLAEVSKDRGDAL